MPPRARRPLGVVATQRLLIAVRAPLQAVANDMAQVADPTTDGNTFTVPLRLATDNTATPAVVGYWCSWAMDDAQRGRLLTEFGRQFASVIDPIPAGGQVHRQDSYWLFEAADGQWTPEGVLSALDWALMPAVD